METNITPEESTVVETSVETQPQPMVESGVVPEPQMPLQQDPPKKKLWSLLTSKEGGEVYTKSYDEFVKQFSNPKSIRALHDLIASPDYELYTKGADAFEQQFFSDIKKKEPTVGAMPSTGLPAGESVSTEQTTEVTEQPVITQPAQAETTPTEAPAAVPGEPLPLPEGYDAISLAIKANELKNRKIKRSVTSKNVMGQDISTTIEDPDESAIAESKRIEQELKSYGIDSNEIYNKIKDLPEDVYRIQVKKADGTVYNKYSKDNLTKLALESPLTFDYTINSYKNRFALKNAINNLDPSYKEELIKQGKPVDATYISELYNSLNQAETLDQFEQNQIKQQELINTYLPTMEERRAAINRAKENTATFLTPNNIEIIKAYEQSPLRSKIDISQFSALEVMKLYEPQKYEQALKFINAPLVTETEPSASISFTGNGFEYGVAAPKETEESIDTKIGKETILKTLSDQGRQYAILDLQRQNEKLAAATKNPLTPEQLESIKTQYSDNLLKINAVKNDYKKDVERFPLTSDLKYETQVKDFLNQAGFNAAEYGVSRLGKGFENTYSSMNNIVTKLFGSDMDNTINQMKALGFKKREEADFYMPEAYQGNAPLFLTQFEKPLADKLNAIIQGKDLKDLSKKQLDDISNVLMENQNQVKIVTNPNGGKPKNFLSLATLYSNTAMLGDIASFALQAGALKGIGASDALASAIPMWSTSQADFYREAVEKGVQDPDGYADVHASIMFMAAMINPTLGIVKRAVGVDTKLGQMLLGVSEKTWNNVVNKNNQLLTKIQNSLSHTAKEATGMALTFGAGTSLAGDVINKQMYAEDITGGQMIDNAIESMKHILNSSASLLSIGAISNFKGTPMVEKSALWQLSNNKDFNLARIDEALKAGKISEDQAISRKKVIEDVSDIVNKMPNKDVNGKLMTDDQRLNYFYNLLLKRKGEEQKSVMPKPQQKKIDFATKVIDFQNDLIVDPKTEEELSQRKTELEELLSPKVDEKGKTIELKEDEREDYEAELEAINKEIDKINKEKQPTQTTEQILNDEPGTETDLEQEVEEKDVTVRDVLNKRGKYNGQSGEFYQDGQQVIFRVEGTNKEYELGNIEAIGDQPLKDFGIEHEESVVSINENGNFVIRGQEFKNNYSDPMQAINRDAKGEIVSVTLDLPNGQKRTFRGNVAQDIAYQLHLQELSKNNETAQFEEFLSEPEQQQQINDAEVSIVTPEITVTTVEPVQREKIKPTKTEVTPAKPTETTPTEIAGYKVVSEETPVGGERVFKVIDENGNERFLTADGKELRVAKATAKIPEKEVTPISETKVAELPTKQVEAELETKPTETTEETIAEEYEPDEEELARQDWQDELDNSGYSYGQYGGKSSDTYYIRDNKTKKVVKEIKFTDSEEGRNEVYKWIDQQAGTKIFEKSEKLRQIAEGNKKEKVTEEEPIEEPIEVKEPESPAERKSLADKIRGLKSKEGKIYDATIGIPVALWDTSLEIIAKTIEAGESVADAIKKGIAHINKNYKDKWDVNKYFNKVNEQFTSSEKTSKKSIPTSNKDISDVIQKMRKENEDIFDEVVFNWADAEVVVDYDGKISFKGYPGRDRMYSRGKEGGSYKPSKKEFINWLVSDKPFDPKEYVQDESWVNNIKTLRQSLGIKEVNLENISKLDAKKKNELSEKANIFYHGTVANFKEFIANKIRSGAIQIKGALFFTNKKARAEAFGLQSYKNVSSELFNLSRGILNLNQYESYKNSTKELPKDLMNNVNNYFKSIGIEENIKTIGDLAKKYEKYRSEKEAKYNVKAIKIKEGAKIKVIEGKKNWKETLSKLDEESGKLKNEYKGYDVLIFKNIEDYPLMEKPSEEITNGDNIVVLNPSKIENIENESEAIYNSYQDALKVSEKERTAQQNDLIKSVNEALGISELPQQKGTEEAKPEAATLEFKEPKTDAERKSIADQLRQLKSGKGKAYDAVLGIPVAIWDGTVELIAKAIEGGTAVADALKRGINYIEKNHRGRWDKKGFNDKVIESLGLRGINVNGEDIIVKPLKDKQSAEVINGFYSPLEQGILDAKVEKATGKEWAKKLEGTTEGDELTFTGISDFLSENENKVLSKQEVLDFMKENRIEIVEISKSDEVVSGLSMEEIEDKFKEKGLIIDEQYGEVFIENENQEPIGFEELPLELQPLAVSYGRQLGQAEFKESQTKYSAYQLPGVSSNYKEVLITLPIKEKINAREELGGNPEIIKNSKESEDINGVELDKGEQMYYYPSGLYLKRLADGRFSVEVMQEYKTFDNLEDAELWLSNKSVEVTDTVKHEKRFVSSHFNEPNILAHIRMNTRFVEKENEKYLNPKTYKPNFDSAFELIDEGDYYKVKKKGASSEYATSYSKKIMSENKMSENDLKEYLMDYNRLGKEHPDFKDNRKKLPVKVLHIEEFQSDWGQEGKKKGFDVSPDKKQELSNLQDKLYKLSLEKESLFKTEKIGNTGTIKDFKQTIIDKKRYEEINKEISILENKQSKLKKGDIPQAPFVTETANWTKLAWKVALKEAVKEGADKITWTTGEQQGERYDLRKQVDSINYYKRKDGTYNIDAIKDGSSVSSGIYKENELEGILGKEVAKKIINNEGDTRTKYEFGQETRYKSLEGDNLAVGGKGMIGFYGSPSEGKLGIVGEVAKSLFKQEPKTTKLDLNDYVADYVNVYKKYNGTYEVNWTEKNGQSFVKEFDYEKDANEWAKKLKGEPISFQHSIDITPEMKEGVKAGMAMFKSPFQKLADTFRSLKSDPNQAYESILGIPVAVWDGIMEAAAKAAELTEDVVKITKDAINHLKNTDWYKNLSSTEKTKAETNVINKIKDALGVEAEPEQKESVTIETKHPYLYTGSDKKRVAGLMRNLMEAENVSSRTKQLLKKDEGLEYAVASNVDAEIMARDVIESFGEKDALQIARQTDMHPSVRSAIYAKLIDSAYEKELNAKTNKEKTAAAEKWAELSKEYSKQLTAGGQFTAYAGHYYRTSPMGFVMRENAIRADLFEDWLKGREESYSDIYKQIIESPEFKREVSKAAEEGIKEERKARREKRDKNIDDFFDSAKMKGGTYSTLIPPALWNKTMDAMKVAVKAGDRVVDIVQKAIEDISKEIGDNWDKNKFRKDFESALTKVADEGQKERLGITDLESKIKSLEKQIEDYEEKIAKGGEAGKKKEVKFSDNPKVQKLIETRDRLKKENEELLKASKQGKYSDEARNEAAQKAAQKAIDDLEVRLRDNDLAIERSEKLNETDKTKQLREKRKQLSKELDDRRKAAKIGRYSDQAKAIAEAKRKQESINELNRRIDEQDFSSEVYKAKKAKDALQVQLDEVRERYKQEREKSKEWKEKKARQFLEKFKDKWPGLTEAQKKKVIEQSIKKIAESGGLKEEEFRKFVAEALGIKEVTPEEAKEMEDLTATINKVDDALQAMLQNPTPATIAAYQQAKQAASIAGLRLKTMVTTKENIAATYKSIILGSLLGIVTNVTNFLSNVYYQASVRFETAALKQAGELGTYGSSVIANRLFNTRLYEPTSNLIEAQKGYLSGQKAGWKTGWFDFYNNTQQKDYFSKNTYRSTLDPKGALKDIKDWWRGEKYLTKGQLHDRMIRMTLGWQPDFILRAMSFGDRPFRWGAEQSKARQIAVMEMKLKDTNQINAFLMNPKAFAEKLFIDRGESQDKAETKAQEIEDRILEEGNKAVFEVETVLSWVSKKFDEILVAKKDETWNKKALKNFASVLKTSQLPFIRIPAYMYWTMYKIINPEISLIQMAYHFGEAKYWESKGEGAKSRAAFEKGKDDAYLAAYGAAVGLAVTSLVGGGYVRPSNDEETKAREAAGEKTFGKQGVLNLGRLMGTDDWWVSLKWFGPLGAALDTRAKINEERQKEFVKTGVPEEFTLIDDATDNLTQGAKDAMNNLVFDNASRIANSIKTPETAGKEWMVYNANTLQKMFTGATYAQISKAMLPYQANTKADGMIEEINNNAKTQNVLYRFIAGKPSPKISIWGEPIKQDNTLSGVMFNILGWEKENPNQYGAILFRDYLDTKDDRFFPVPEDKTFTVDGKRIDLTQEQKNDLDKFVGQARKNMVGPFVYDLVATNAYTDATELDPSKNKVYSQLKPKEKIEALTWVYKAAKDSGYAKFKVKYPQFLGVDDKAKEMVDKAMREARKTLIDVDIINKGGEIKKP